MKGYELVEGIAKKKIEDCELKVTKGSEICRIKVVDGVLKWETGTFHTGYLTDPAVDFEVMKKPTGRLKPKKGEWYWCINSCGVLNRDNWDGGEVDLYRYNSHNCFRSEEEIQEYLDYKEALRKAEKPFVNNKNNYCFQLDEDENNKLELYCNVNKRRQGTTYLGQSATVAQAFIDKWKTQILKYEFDVWEWYK